MFGKLFHLCFDAVLISMILSGIRRGSGLSMDLKSLPNDFRQIVRGWLEMGEWVSQAAYGRGSWR